MLINTEPINTSTDLHHPGTADGGRYPPVHVDHPRIPHLRFSSACLRVRRHGLRLSSTSAGRQPEERSDDRFCDQQWPGRQLVGGRQLQDPADLPGPTWKMIFLPFFSTVSRHLFNRIQRGVACRAGCPAFALKRTKLDSGISSGAGCKYADAGKN